MTLDEAASADSPDLLGGIRAWRTVGRFDPSRRVPPGLIRMLLELACLAPSSFNLQPWRFVVVRDEANRRRLRACSGNQPRITEAPVVVIVLGYHGPMASHLELARESMIGLGAADASEAAELCGRARSFLERLLDLPAWAGRTSMLSAATLMLAAEAFGLGSALLDVTDPGSIRDAFGIPDDHELCCLVALGYASAPSAFPGRLGLEEISYGEHFGAPLMIEDAT